ncbi:MAG TPA: DUF2625 domain-containing protein [Chitinophagaceae bacterium]|nr:DUF2625 domain-containing protein [Chitinophagaceae bacterium]
MKYLHRLILCIYLVPMTIYGQIKMKPLNELVVKDSSTWNMVKQWIKDAKNPVEVLPKNKMRADSALYLTQVTTRSPMGAIIYETGGLLIDSGWIRILGSGNRRLDRSLMDWNKGKSFNNVGEPTKFLLIADDVLGGFFAINAGAFDTTNIGKVFYFSPDNLKWENTQLTYTDFLFFCFTGDLNKYYQGFKWNNWQKDASSLNGNEGMAFLPFLWSKEGQKDINKNKREKVLIQTLWDLYFKQK